MAVKIVSIGKLPSQREWYGTCSKCKTKVEYLQEDAIESGDYQRDGAWSTLNCPLAGCSSLIYGSPKPRTAN
jgi:hypothetical protein